MKNKVICLTIGIMVLLAIGFSLTIFESAQSIERIGAPLSNSLFHEESSPLFIQNQTYNHSSYAIVGPISTIIGSDKNMNIKDGITYDILKVALGTGPFSLWLYLNFTLPVPEIPLYLYLNYRIEEHGTYSFYSAGSLDVKNQTSSSFEAIRSISTTVNELIFLANNSKNNYAYFNGTHNIIQIRFLQSVWEGPGFHFSEWRYDFVNLKVTYNMTSPLILSWSSPASPEYDDTVHIIANVTDPDGISQVYIKWTTNNWVTNDTTRTMVLQYQNTWRTNLPLPAKAYQSIIRWEIRANDTWGNMRYSYFSYQVQDFTAPIVVAIDYSVAAVEAFQPFVINVTMSEPAPASGIDLNNVFIVYALASEGYATLYYESLTQEGTTNYWDGSILGLPLNETVQWLVFVKDLAGNNYTSSTFSYTVTEVIVLVNWTNFIFWIIVVLGATLGVFAFLRKSIPKKYYYVLGIAMLVGITLLLWALFPWWQFAGLNYQQYLQLLGNSWQISVIVGIGITLFMGVVGLWYLNPYRPPKAATIVHLG